jgi:hypothetical protein
LDPASNMPKGPGPVAAAAAAAAAAAPPADAAVAAASAAEAREEVARAARIAAKESWARAERQDRAVGAALRRAAALMARAKVAEQARGRLAAGLDR